MSYGFRLFEATLLNGRKRSALPLIKQGGWNYPALAANTWRAQAETKKTEYGMPRPTELDADDAVDAGEAPIRRIQPVFRVDSVELVDQTYPLVTVYHGRPSGHSKAIPDEDFDNQQDLDISNHSPVRPYRAVLFTTTSGAGGILAVEAIGRACPGPPLVRWLNSWIASEHHTGDEPKFRLRIEPLSDEAKLKAVIKDSQTTEMVLRKYKVGGDRNRRSLVRELKAPIGDAHLAQRARTRMRSWFERESGGTAMERASKETAIDEVAALVGEDVSGQQYDDAWIVVHDEYGHPRKVSPDRLSDVFVYDVADDVSPDTEILVKAMKDAISRIARSRSMSFDWMARR